MTKDEILQLDGNFTWMFGNEFFIETEKGNFIWSDPDYEGGTNTVTPTTMDYTEYVKASNVPFGRDKGVHNIERYCGPDIIIVE